MGRVSDLVLEQIRHFTRPRVHPGPYHQCCSEVLGGSETLEGTHDSVEAGSLDEAQPGQLASE